MKVENKKARRAKGHVKVIFSVQCTSCAVYVCTACVLSIRQPPAFQYKLYACLYLCLPLLRCIKFCCLIYLVFSVFHLYFVSIAILQNAEKQIKFNSIQFMYGVCFLSVRVKAAK